MEFRPTLVKRISISVILNCHREGEILRPSFRAAVESLHKFDSSGLNWELVCVADRCDEETMRVLEAEVSRCRPRFPNIRVLQADLGDLGLSRNLGVERARGEFVGFVDADDLVSRNWFSAAFACAQRDRNAIFHPECNFYFGVVRAFMVHRDQCHYDLWALFFHNLWTALSFGPVAVYRRFPYQRNQLDQGFGYEDWHWNCETIAHGLEHRMVDQTIHFIRVRESSLSQESLGNQCVIRRTVLWQWLRSRPTLRDNTSRHWLYQISEFWARRRQLRTGQDSPGTLGKRLFADPADVTLREFPEWIRPHVLTAASDDPAVELSGTLFNFSPILPNPFVPHLPGQVMDGLCNGISTIRFVSSPKQIAASDLEPNDLIFVEGDLNSDPRFVALHGLKAGLSSKFDLFLAMVIVQSGCVQLQVYEKVAHPEVLDKYQKVMASCLKHIGSSSQTARRDE